MFKALSVQNKFTTPEGGGNYLNQEVFTSSSHRKKKKRGVKNEENIFFWDYFFDGVGYYFEWMRCWKSYSNNTAKS